jgi:integrase
MENEKITGTAGTVLSLRNGKDAVIENSTACYIQAATSQNTRTAYQADIRHFIQWGGRLPTCAESVLRYLHHYAGALNPRTLARRLTALKQWHLYQGFTDPTAHPAIHKTLTGIKNIHGKPKEKAIPLTLQALSKLSALLKGSSRLIDCRNRALLLVGFLGAFRGSELVGIRWSAITFVPEGMEILVPRSKTDQGGEGQVCAVPKSEAAMLCPVAAMTEWRERSGSTRDPVFRQMTAGGRVLNEAIKPHQVNAIIKSMAIIGDLPQAESYSSHSMRRGFATEASRTGVPFASIMRHGRWRHEGTVLGYIDEGRRFDQNAACIMLSHAQQCFSNFVKI